MRSKMLFGLFAFLLAVTVQAQHHHPGVGVHGMLLIGEESFYLSHLPMFHAPHAAQVILEAKLDEKSKAEYLKSLKAGQVKYHTVVPEPFDLFKMPKEFKAQLFAGHFERGGKLIAGSVKVIIKQVLHFRSFKELSAKPAQAKFLRFGKGKDKFMAHAIYSKPDFDQILRVEGVPLHMGILNLPKIPNDSPLKGHQEVEIEGPKLTTIRISIGESIYLETSDLSH